MVANALYLIRNTFTGQLELAAVGADGITVAKQPTKTEIQQWIDAAVPESAAMADKLSTPKTFLPPEMLHGLYRLTVQQMLRLS